MVRKLSRKEVPDVQVPKRKATDFEIASNSVLVELDSNSEQVAAQKLARVLVGRLAAPENCAGR